MLKKTAFIVFLIVAFANYAFAADVVHLKSGVKYEGKVIAIHPDTVELSTGEGKPIRFILIKDIRVIVYESGQTEAFGDTLAIGEEKQELKEIKAKLVENEKQGAKTSGILIGVGICAAIFFILLVVGSSSSSSQ